MYMCIYIYICIFPIDYWHIYVYVFVAFGGWAFEEAQHDVLHGADRQGAEPHGVCGSMREAAKAALTSATQGIFHQEKYRFHWVNPYIWYPIVHIPILYNIQYLLISVVIL